MLFVDLEAKMIFLFSMIKELACKNIESLEHNFKVVESAKDKHECVCPYILSLPVRRTVRRY